MSEPATKRLRVDESGISSTALLTKADSDEDDEMETMELSESSRLAKEKHEEKLRQVEALRKARTIIVPTKDALVRRRLRELHHPITLFGETAPGRRERLRAVMARLAVEGQLTSGGSSAKQDYLAAKTEQGKNAYVFKGSEDLKTARVGILKCSLRRAAVRLAAQQEKFENEEGTGAPEEEIRRIATIEKEIRGFANTSSEIGDSRPISSCSFQPSSQHVATSSWSGYCKIWSIPDCANVGTLKNNDSRVTDIKFHPHSGQTLSNSAANLATCDVDGRVYLWGFPDESSKQTKEEKSEMEDEKDGEANTNTNTKEDETANKKAASPLHCLEGHKSRCSKIAWVPDGKHLISTSYDCTWRLWDTETQKQVLMQRGHSRPTYGVGVQCDGALVATGDLGGNTRLWDLRVGKSLMPLKGHTKQVLCCDFSPNGYTLATGADDNTIKIWELRKRECLYTIPAHTKTISSLRWQPTHGNYLVSTGYDNMAKIWSGSDFQILNELAGHEGRVMGCDVSPDTKYIVTSSFDRTFKLWEPEKEMDIMNF